MRVLGCYFHDARFSVLSLTPSGWLVVSGAVHEGGPLPGAVHLQAPKPAGEADTSYRRFIVDFMFVPL